LGVASGRARKRQGQQTNGRQGLHHGNRRRKCEQCDATRIQAETNHLYITHGASSAQVDHISHESEKDTEKDWNLPVFDRKIDESFRQTGLRVESPTNLDHFSKKTV
jgi:hypothetical protein